MARSRTSTHQSVQRIESAHIKKMTIKLKGYPKVRNKHLRAAMIRRTRILRRAIATDTPVKTGKLKRGWVIKDNTPSKGRIINRHNKYLGFVIMGTDSHMIFPRRKKVLRFVIRGRVIFATKVHHPGTKPNDFVTRAGKRTKKRIAKIYKSEMDKALKTLKIK